MDATHARKAGARLYRTGTDERAKVLHWCLDNNLSSRETLLVHEGYDLERYSNPNRVPGRRLAPPLTGVHRKRWAGMSPVCGDPVDLTARSRHEPTNTVATHGPLTGSVVRNPYKTRR